MSESSPNYATAFKTKQNMKSFNILDFVSWPDTSQRQPQWIWRHYPHHLPPARPPVSAYMSLSKAPSWFFFFLFWTQALLCPGVFVWRFVPYLCYASHCRLWFQFISGDFTLSSLFPVLALAILILFVHTKVLFRVDSLSSNQPLSHIWHCEVNSTAKLSLLATRVWDPLGHH